MLVAWYIMEEFTRACEEAVEAAFDAMLTPMIQAWAERELERYR